MASIIYCATAITVGSLFAIGIKPVIMIARISRNVLKK